MGIQNARIDLSTNLGNLGFNITGEVINEIDLNIYNVVTPNGDGIHDFFKIGNIEAYPDNWVAIHDRWGRKVYEVNAYNNTDRFFSGIGNNGNSKELLNGTYYYIIFKGDGTEKLTGYLILSK